MGFTNDIPFLSFLLAIATTSVTISASELCSNAEMERVRVEYSTCTSRIRHAFLPTAISVQHNLKNVDDVCKIVNETVFGCGKVYEKCFDDEGAKAMRHLQLKIFSEVFAKAHKMEKLINQCKVVKDFKAKEGNFSAWRPIICEQEVAVNRTEQYHECIDQVNINMTNRIIDEPDVSAGGIYDLLCDGMHDIVVKCSIILADCYGPEDMLDMRNGQLKLTQKIFFDVLKMTNQEELKNFLGKRQCESLARMGYLMNKNESSSIQHHQKSIFIILRILSTVLLSTLLRSHLTLDT